MKKGIVPRQGIGTDLKRGNSNTKDGYLDKNCV